MFILYRVAGTKFSVSLTFPASERQIIAALKAEGAMRINERFASYRVTEQIVDHAGDKPGCIYVWRGQNYLAYKLVPLSRPR